MSEEQYIIGELQAIFFENSSNYYKIMLIQIQESNTDYDEDEIVITGNFGEIKDAISYKFYGHLVNHPKYGLQFKNERYEKLKPSSRESLINFLSGPKFKGIGPVIAENIVDTLGEDAVNLILDQPDALDRVDAMTEKRKKALIKGLKEEEGLDRVILKLNELGIQNNLAYKIYDHYQENTLQQIHDNPYQLVIDIDAVSFNRADALAEELNIKADSPERLAAGLMQSLKNQTFNQGHTYVLREQLLIDTIDLLEQARPFIIDDERVDQLLDQLIEQGMIVEEQQALYLPSLYAAEWGIVKHISRLLEREEAEAGWEDDDWVEVVEDIEEQQGFIFGSSQKEAMEAALSSSLFILTGGPGTGKTTVVNGIVQAYARLHDISLDQHAHPDHFPILMAAPTGRAAKRLGETTHLPASTIHRLLGLTAEDSLDLDPKYFDHQLEGDLLIIDEMSMVDTYLFYHLLSAVPDGMKVILIGDKDQLPSVGPGQVFSDLIASGQIPGQELTEIYRQEADSSIPFLAAQIKNGHWPENIKEKKKDRSFIPCHYRQVVDVVDQIIRRAMQAGYDPFDIQVLAPMYKGQAGIDAMNQRLQDVFNPNPNGERKEIKVFDQVYRVDDKVLQLTNEPELNIFNGDIGTIQSIELAKDKKAKVDQMVIRFDEIEVEYQRSDFNKIKLAYCMSIHKAQGSEFKSVVLPFVKAYHRMLRKDLLYTAITRASDSLILCGEEQAFLYSLSQDSNDRQTSLVQRFLGEETSLAYKETEPSLEKEKELDQESEASSVLTVDMIENLKVSPMIGMEDISPYDF